MSMHNYVTLGRSGLRVSPFCLGTMTFGMDWDWGTEVEESCRIIDAYLDRGGNFLDTANIYTKGHSERIIGDHLGRDPSKRERTVIATKFLGNMYLGDPNGGGASRKSMVAACEQSLRRLQTDYIDLYWMHFHDPHTPVEETLRAMEDLVRSGKVRYLGFSDMPAWLCAKAQMIAEFRGWSPLIGLQIEYSLIERSPEFDLLPMARDMGMGVTPWSPLKGGLLTDKYRSGTPTSETKRGWMTKHLDNPRVQQILSALGDVATRLDRPMSDIAMAWCLQRDGVDSIIFGARTMAQLEQNLAAADLTLAHSDIQALDEASVWEPTPFPHAFLPLVLNNIQGGTTVNGIESEQWNLAPQNDDERW